MLKQVDFQWQKKSGLGFNDLRSLNNESSMSMNLVQGGIPQGHGRQDGRLASSNPLLVDVSPCGSSVGSGRSSMNPCSVVQTAYLTAASDTDEDQKIITQLQGFKTPFVSTCSQDHRVTPQGFPEKTPSMLSSVLGLSGDSSSVQDRESLLGTQQNPRRSSQGSVALDPLEEKILYHTDDNVQDSSFGRNNNEIGSGGFSLSALMQCALEEDTGPLDDNGNDQIPGVHSFTLSLENACTSSSGMSQLVLVSPEMNQSCLALPSSVQPVPHRHDLSQYEHWANRSWAPGEAEMSGTGYAQGQTHMQVTCNLSLLSKPSDLSTSFTFCMNSPRHHQLVAATNKIPMTFPMVEQKPSEVYNASMNVLSEGSTASCFSKASCNTHQNSAILGQPHHNDLTGGYLKTDDGPDTQEIDCTAEQRQEENVNSEPVIISNIKHVASEETGKTLCLQSFPQFPNGLVPVGSHLDALNQNMVALEPKKRKRTTFWQSPWHKVVLQGSDKAQSISMSEQEWAVAANRLLEKIEDNIGASVRIPPSKRRLILSTQLMQQLLPPAPSFTLSGNAAVYHEGVLYFVSRTALGDACGVMCYARNSLQSRSDKSRKISEKIETSKKAGDKYQQYAQIGKALVEKIQNLESDFQRLHKTASISDIVVEIQDLERFSVINRFAKFHSRVQATSKSVPQRYVTGLPLPKTLPEGVLCLPL